MKESARAAESQGAAALLPEAVGCFLTVGRRMRNEKRNDSKTFGVLSDLLPEHGRGTGFYGINRFVCRYDAENGRQTGIRKRQLLFALSALAGDGNAAFIRLVRLFTRCPEDCAAIGI